MKATKQRIGCVAAVLGIVLSAGAATLDYQGRVMQEGSDFSGQGYFKYVLHNDKGGGLWSNDGTRGVGEPKKAVPVRVRRGLFSIQLGDAELDNMDAIPPLALHAQTVKLRVWFSEKSRGPYQQLKPDVAIHPLDLAHIDTGDLVIVDDNGDGDFDNLQAAVNAVATNAAFHAVLVMPGTYSLNAPLSAPAGNPVHIRGLIRDAVIIENSKGAALVPFNGSIEDVSIRGYPAINDTGSAGAFQLDIRRCSLSGSQGGAIVLGNSAGDLRLEACTVASQGGAAVAIIATESARRGSFRALSSELQGGPTVRLGISDKAGTQAPVIIDCALIAPEGQPTVDVAGGEAGGSIRMLNSVLSANVADGITILPSTELPGGNAVVTGR